jgi:hypothetical protein
MAAAVWLLAEPDNVVAGGFKILRDERGELGWLKDGELACATAASLSALGLDAFALPATPRFAGRVVADAVMTEGKDSDAEPPIYQLDLGPRIDPGGEVIRARVADYLASVLRGRVLRTANERQVLEGAS